MAIEVAAGIGMSLIASEHFFSTFLSSPWTTAKFAETEEDKEQVRRLMWMAIATSLITGAILSAILKEPWPIISAAALCVMYWVVYNRAMGGRV